MYDAPLSPFNVDLSQYAATYNCFTEQLIGYCLSHYSKKNTFVSPLSVLLLLSMIADATAADTRAEILSALSVPHGINDIGALLGAFQQALKADGCHSANAAFIRSDIFPTLRSDYTKRLRHVYDGEVFPTTASADRVNHWIKRQTHSMIENAIKEKKDVLLSLINAVAFEEAWAHPFENEDVSRQLFYNIDDSRNQVSMLNGYVNHYLENDRFTGFLIQYASWNWSYMALLPKERGAAALQQSIAGMNITEIFQSQRYCSVKFKLPEYKISAGYELSDFCKSQGISEVFTDEADFSPLSPLSLKLDSIEHKAYVEVNRQGTRAAAVSMSDIILTGLPPNEQKQVYINRPFIFAIIHQKSRLPLFTGIVNQL